MGVNSEWVTRARFDELVEAVSKRTYAARGSVEVYAEVALEANVRRSLMLPMVEATVRLLEAGGHFRRETLPPGIEAGAPWRS